MIRKIGEKSVPAVGLGCMGMSEFYGAVDDDHSLSVLDRAYELGYRHFDTADMYGFGHNETLLGRFFRRKPQARDSVFLATKVGIVRDRNERFKLSIDGSANYVKRACEASLRRLDVDDVDLVYLHRCDPELLEESIGALADLVTAGKVRAIGVCEVSAATLARAHAIHPIAALQSEYSLWSRDVEAEVLPACRALDVAFVAFSPLGRGFLTGTVGKQQMKDADPELDLRTRLPRFSKENLGPNLLLAERLRELADATGVAMAQLSLAWLLAKSDSLHVIPGTRRLRYLEENFAAQAVPVDAELSHELERAFAATAVQGARYPGAFHAQPSR